MSATNSTTHYSLPSFLGTDKPAWLVDWNGAMATIDSAIYEAKQAADTAGTSASAVASDLATLSGTVSTQGSTISTLSETLTTAVGNINTINGNITTINSLIGNGTPTTTDQTIIGAINEINAEVKALNTDTLNNEVVIGKFNNKTLYRRVYAATGQTITASTDLDSTLTTALVDNVVNMNVCAKTSAGVWLSNYDDSSSGSRQECILTLTATAARLGIAGLTISDYVAIIEYTKA